MQLEEVIKYIERNMKKFHRSGGVFGDGKFTYVTDGVLVYKTESEEGVDKVPPILITRMEQFDTCKIEYDVEKLDLSGETVKLGTCWYNSTLIKFMKKAMGKRAKYYYSENFNQYFDLCGASNDKAEMLLISIRRGFNHL